MTDFETARTVRYTGPDPDEVRRAFAADSERALAAGYVVTRSWWDSSQGQPVLVVDYVHASVDRQASRPTAVGPSTSGPAPTHGRRGGLGEAMLVAGVILAAIIVLAVTIPTAAPAPTPAPSVAPVQSLVPASSLPPLVTPIPTA